MLARLFDRPCQAISIWPDDVWTYLNSVPTSGIRRQTQLESLKQDWVTPRRISSQSSASAERKIAFLTSSISEAPRLSLSDLSDRSAMLADTRAQAALMKRDLG